jgi:hypothetical protein
VPHPCDPCSIRLAGALLLLAPLLLVAGPGIGDPPSTLHVEVRESPGGALLPCRLTIVGPDGAPAMLRSLQSRGVAVRPGVLYSPTGTADIHLPPGSYRLYATRGPEYSLAQHRLELRGKPLSLRLSLRREVDTDGYVSCDTHVHTLTFSGHGDATAEERMATLAGEGVELPVAAEHNRTVDYAPIASASGVSAFFTPIVGDEVTTPAGHFIAFPLRPDLPPPPFTGRDRTALAAAAWARPEAPVLVLNHPRDLHEGFVPAAPERFHPLSGESFDGNTWAFDGIEVINSGALRSDWMEPYRDWFALLNFGHRIVGVGASDSHDVDRSIVGQARTYLPAPGPPGRIDVAAACRSLREGRALVSMGLFTQAWVEERAGPGDLARSLPEQVRIRVRVQSPRWVRADRIELFRNGEKVASQPLPPSSALRRDVRFRLPRPTHDAWLVAIASGPGVREPYWPFQRPYQPTRADWEPRAIGSTSAIYLDGDGDGRYRSPREQAALLVDASRLDPGILFPSLTASDAAVAVQAASLCRARGMDLRSPAVRRALDRAAPQVRQAFLAYLSAVVEPTTAQAQLAPRQSRPGSPLRSMPAESVPEGSRREHLARRDR